jgi:hypothetical protein
MPLAPAPHPTPLNCGCPPVPWPPPLIPRNPPVPAPAPPAPLPAVPRRPPCPDPNPHYNLRGPQVEPEASVWTMCRLPCIVRIDELVKRTDNPQDPCYFPPYPTAPEVVKDEVEELIELASLRDDPDAIYNKEYRRRRKGLSPFLQLRPQPLGAVVNIDRDPLIGAIRAGRPPQPDAVEIERGMQTNAALPVIRTGRELARYFESETPGLAHRLALNDLLRQSNFSPPRQALIWACLDIAISSALLAAWYYKWAAGVGLPPCQQSGNPGTHPRAGVSYRPRPIEMDYRVSVLYNRQVNASGTGDDGMRRLPNPSPGTPRHPAYPSGHSTYSGAASEILSFFFPDYTEEFDRLADNIGMARLWAGIHWRTDHCEGMKLGRCVARMVIEQLQGACICPPDFCTMPNNCAPPPPPDALRRCAEEACRCCGHRPERRPCIDLDVCQPESLRRPEGAGPAGAGPAEVQGVREGGAEAEAAEGTGGATSDAGLREQAEGPQEGAAPSGSSEAQRKQARGPQKGARGTGDAEQRAKEQAEGPQEGGR